MYDVIGDIHGHYRELHNLLVTMGYEYDSAAHNFSHPMRKPLFLGDYIDAGSENMKSLQLVQNMVQSGRAVAIMGNHDFNAVQYATPLPGKPGEFLRKHSEKNTHQHQTFLREVECQPELYASAIAWMKTLPVYFKDADLHTVHACWDAAAIEALTQSGSMTATGQITPEGWIRSADKETWDYDHFETLLKGPEEKIENGHSFKDAYGIERSKGRIKWWVEAPATYGEAYTLSPTATFADLPFVSSGDSLSTRIREGLKSVDKLMFGHYWMNGEEPAVLSPRTACLDYSVARKGGKLVAYRVQSGETHLHNRNFVWVPRLN